MSCITGRTLYDGAVAHERKRGDLIYLAGTIGARHGMLIRVLEYTRDGRGQIRLRATYVFTAILIHSVLLSGRIGGRGGSGDVAFEVIGTALDKRLSRISLLQRC